MPKIYIQLYLSWEIVMKHELLWNTKENRTIADLKYAWEDSIGPSTLIFVAIKG